MSFCGKVKVVDCYFHRLNFSTPFSTNAVSICKSIGLRQITRIEVSVRYQISFCDGKPSSDIEDRLVHILHDRMTQCRYLEPVKSFELKKLPEPVFDVDVMGEGSSALEKANVELGRTIFFCHSYGKFFFPHPTTIRRVLAHRHMHACTHTHTKKVSCFSHCASINLDSNKYHNICLLEY